MPSKLRKAIGAVKDQTSISLAKVSSNNSSNLDVAVLKATTHEEVPVDERYVNEVLLLTSSNKIYAAACAHAIAKRIGRTRNWIVALKSLMLVLRLFQDGDPYFPREVLHVMKRGAKILNLSNFRDDSNSSPWDYTAFVRTYALYLDERLNCFLMGKLQRRAVLRDRLPSQRRKRHSNEHVRDMKPAMLLDRISYWQRLLERALATRPTGAAKTNRLIQISLYSVVRESFDLYRDISDGLALLLDSFFHLQYQSCVEAFQTCVKASKQFEELCGFYTLCRGIGVGRTSEYPSVQKISDELIETLQEFLKDQSSFPSGSARTVQGQLLLPAPPNLDETGSSTQLHDTYERDSDMGSVSLEDLFSVTDAATSPSVSFSISMDQDQLSEQLDKQSCFQDDFMTSPNMTGTSPSISVDQREGSVLDLAGFFDDQTSQQEEKQQETSVSGSSAREGWELELAECANNISSTCASNISSTHEAANNGFDSSLLDSLYASHQTPMTPHQHTYSNPFLSSDMDMSMAISPIHQHERHYSSSPVIQHDHYSSFPVVAHHDHFSSFPTFQAASSTPPTFSAQNPDDIINDPFATYSPKTRDLSSSDGSMNQQHLIQEQQLWLQNQNKIIARHIS